MGGRRVWVGIGIGVDYGTEFGERREGGFYDLGAGIGKRVGAGIVGVGVGL